MSVSLVVLLGALLLPSSIAPLVTQDGGEKAASQEGAGEQETIPFFRPDADDAATAVAETTVGMRVEMLELVIPGSAVQAKPVADPGRARALVRIKHEYTHGTGFRYDLEFTPFVEGELNLLDFLERKDGTSLEDAPELLVFVEAVLEAETLLPKDPDVPHPDSVGGYRKLMIAAGIAWGVGLLMLLFVGRRKVAPELEAAGARPRTLADRLRPLVEEARRSEISSERRAELERLLLAHWRRRRGLEKTPVAEAVMQLRADDEAGPLFRQLEAWLHRPPGAAEGAVDVAALLAPYQNVAADEASGEGRA